MVCPQFYPTKHWLSDSNPNRTWTSSEVQDFWTPIYTPGVYPACILVVLCLTVIYCTLIMHVVHIFAVFLPKNVMGNR